MMHCNFFEFYPLMSLLFVDQDILILHLKQLSSFWGVLYIPMQRRDFACAGFPVTVLFTQGNIRVSQVPELPL
ncbi:hypothetical protein BuS5_00916 [Desulfosarcina sp. BuS5]|nr:hypothetical protein BuS5_00916 [Desulfosarcina sp. BuS5]